MASPAGDLALAQCLDELVCVEASREQGLGDVTSMAIFDYPRKKVK
jgi:hypothetical protein